MKKYKFNKIYYFLIFLSFIIIIYFLINPLFYDLKKFILPHKLKNIEHARSYYSIISYFFSVLLTFFGIVLGFFYYQNRLKFDNQSAFRERKRSHLNFLIEELNNYDNLVDKLISFNFQSEQELKKIRNRINRSFENVIIILEENGGLLEFNNDEIKTILRINSFVEQNELLMYANFKKLSEKLFLIIKDRYINLIQDARRICYKKLL